MRYLRKPWQFVRWVSGHEWATLALFVFAVGAAWLFTSVALEVREGDTEDFDRSVLLALRTPGDTRDPIGPVWFEEAVRDVTALGSTTVLGFLTMLATGHLVLAGKRHAAVLLVATIIGGSLASTLLKEAFDRPRPDVVAHGTHVITASFPSGHSMMSAVTYLTIGVLLARVESRWRMRGYVMLGALAVSVAVGLSRIYLGVHYPTDVAAGWIAGAAWALGCWGLTRRLQKKGAVEPPTSAEADQEAPSTVNAA